MKENQRTIYTLIKYVPGEDGWFDRCGDYNSGKDSELEITYYRNKQDIAKDAAKSTFKNQDLEITILINGIDIDNSPDDITEEEFNYLIKERDSIEGIQQNIMAELKKEEEIILAAKKAKLEEARLKKLQEQQRIEAMEKQQLAKLMAKYN